MTIIKRIKEAFLRLKTNFWKYVSIWDVLIVIAVLLVSNFAYLVITYFYPWTGEPSYQWLYKTVFGLARASIVMAYSFLIIRLLFSGVFFYLRKGLDSDINNITAWQRIILHLFIYFFLLGVFLISVVTF